MSSNIAAGAPARVYSNDRITTRKSCKDASEIDGGRKGAGGLVALRLCILAKNLTTLRIA